MKRPSFREEKHMSNMQEIRSPQPLHNPKVMLAKDSG